ncbi:glycoside hydrolase family 95 protein [Dentipellis sp. KUC8613]|nr:glycoside hydrolase family 95 protein [Dentipellis sp. KUC8613]
MRATYTRPAQAKGGHDGVVLPYGGSLRETRRASHGLLRRTVGVLLLLAAFLYLSPSTLRELWTSGMRRLRLSDIIPFLWGAKVAISAPSGFPKSGNGLWYTKPGVNWNTDLLPIGNGYLGAMIPGGTNQEVTQLNIESLWTGGPFQDPSYNGSNWAPDQRTKLAQEMQQIRAAIFASPTGTIDNVEELGVPAGAYGSYAGAGYLVSTLNVSGDVSGYGRWLDMDQAVARTQWTQGGTSFLRTSFCSNPIQSCIEHINATRPLPSLTYAFSTAAEAGLPTPNVTCLDNATLDIRGLVSTPGMTYELIGRVQAVSSPGHTVKVQCTAVPGALPNATVTVAGAQEAWITWVGGTDYGIDAGDAAHAFSFRGPDPHGALLSLIGTSAPANANASSAPSGAPSRLYAAMLAEHVADFQTLAGALALSLGQTPDLGTPTDKLWAAYATDKGDPYLEWLVFNFGRYLLIGSTRSLLPSNLQGKWANAQTNMWSADYHANINTQMNYWMAEMLGLNVTQSMWDYMEKTWAPRGSETAQILYNIDQGWVTHNEMNIFGHTGMKLDGNSAQWADYPESAAWMMIHVWDHFDYTNDVAWWKAQGWPLLKGVAQFHMQKLIPDLHFNDSTLVTAPCNSPEQVPITFGCAHAQQLIWQLLNSAVKGYAAAGDNDQAFLNEVQTKRDQMDKGIHIGSWGQLQEWKFDMDNPADTHRHLSHLVGLFPGYAVSNFDPSVQGPIPQNGTAHNFTAQQVLDAATTTLIHRGNGTGPDGDTGWEKVWRAAAWAQLGNATEFYHELTYAIRTNFEANLFSAYPPDSTPFQIDANLAYPAVLMNALVQAPDTATYDLPLTITLLPALPANWASGSIKGARLRGGMTLDLEWSGGVPTNVTITTAAAVHARPVRVVYKGKVVDSFSSGAAGTQSLSF